MISTGYGTIRKQVPNLPKSLLLTFTIVWTFSDEIPRYDELVKLFNSPGGLPREQLGQLRILESACLMALSAPFTGIIEMMDEIDILLGI